VVAVDAQGEVSIIKYSGSCSFITDLNKLHYPASRFISCIRLRKVDSYCIMVMLLYAEVWEVVLIM